MTTILDFLKSISPYPIPDRVVYKAAIVRGIDPQAVATRDVLVGRGYRLAEADVLQWLSKAPSVSEGDVSFSFSKTERETFASDAEAIYRSYGEGKPIEEYGYVGDSI